MVSVLVGGSALAAVTYLTSKYFSSLESSPPETRPTPALAAPLTPSDSNQHGANLTRHSSAKATLGSTSNDAPVNASDAPTQTASPSASSIRIAVAPQVAALAKDFQSKNRYMWPLHSEIVSADTALKALCTEASERPDVVIAARRIDREELDTCNRSGADGVMEAKLGHMAMVISRAQIGSAVPVTADALLRAVLKRVPSPQDPQQLIDNPYTDWSQTGPYLEPMRIDVLGPPRDSEEFLIFAATILEPACNKYPWIRDLQSTDRAAYEQICYTLRDDGVYKSAPWDSNFVRQRLWADPAIVAVIDYPFFAANSADLIGSLLPGPPPTSRSIVDGSYVAARPIYLYVSRKRTATVRGFVNEYLRRQDFTYYRWMTAADGSPDSRRNYGEPPQLIEVTLDEQRKQ